MFRHFKRSSSTTANNTNVSCVLCQGSKHKDIINRGNKLFELRNNGNNSEFVNLAHIQHNELTHLLELIIKKDIEISNYRNAELNRRKSLEDKYERIRKYAETLLNDEYAKTSTTRYYDDD